MKAIALIPMLALALPAQAATIHIDDLTISDPLGYSCILESDLERGFGALGKSGRMPQTCLPEPCDRMLSRDEFGMDILGTEPTQVQWDSYVSRYADHCANETTPFGTEPADPVSGTPETFWAPFTAEPIFVSYPTTTYTYLTPTGTPTGSPTVSLVPVTTTVPTLIVVTTDPEGEDETHETPAISPVPLPASLYMLLVAITGLGVAATKRS